MPELEVGQQPAVEEQRGTDTGAEGQHELEALALDDRAALHVGVVGHLGRDPEPFAQRICEREPGPLPDQAGVDVAAIAAAHESSGVDDPAAADQPGEADRDTVVLGELVAKPDELLDKKLGRAGVGRVHPDAVAEHRALGVQDGGLEPAAADVDPERPYVVCCLRRHDADATAP